MEKEYYISKNEKIILFKTGHMLFLKRDTIPFLTSKFFE